MGGGSSVHSGIEFGRSRTGGVPSVHACPAPHRGKTSCRPARRMTTHSRTILTVSACHPLTTATRPPSVAPPRRTMQVPVVSKLALIPATRARRVRTLAQPSVHGMGSGGSAVDAMAVGCLGAESRVERFFALHSIFPSSSTHTQNRYSRC